MEDPTKDQGLATGVQKIENRKDQRSVISERRRKKRLKDGKSKIGGR